MGKLSISERRNKIVRMVMENGSITVRDLSDQFCVTTETIRKDLLALEDQNIVKKGHGDATISSTYVENPFDIKRFSNIEAKARIAERATQMVPRGGIVFIDSGSTGMQVAKLLKLENGLTIITNSLSAAEALLGTTNQMLLTGGELREKSLSFVGSWAVNSLMSVMADIAFIGCDGFHEDGPSIRSYRELQIKQLMITHASKPVLLCDSSKLNNRGLYSFANYNAFDCMITDSGISEEQKKNFESKIELIIV